MLSRSVRYFVTRTIFMPLSVNVGFGSDPKP
jgi:hypothetical protein